MVLAKKTHEVDMCNGSLFPKIVTFFIPVMLSNLLQILYNAADQLIIGKFAGSRPLAAVGSTSSLISLITCLLIGLAVGVSSVTARCFGSGNKKTLSKTTHTSVALSIISGVAIGILGIVFAKPMLKLMGTPDEVIDLATLYMQIYFAGLPATAVFNFCSGILRAIGDAKRPMIFLILSGILNVVLNVIFVVVFKMHVAGVALATIISQALSAYLTLMCLVKSDESYKVNLKEIKIHRAEFMQIIQIAIPSSIQSAAFSISNVFIQSAVNSFGEFTVAGCAAASNIDAFVYQAMNALYHTVLSFAGQNFGANKKGRIVKSIIYCTIVATCLGLIVGLSLYIFAEPLLKMFVDEPRAIEAGLERLGILLPSYFLCGIMEVGAGALRAINKSASSMAGSLIGACGLRILWVFTVFVIFHNVFCLYVIFPISWIATSLYFYIVLFKTIKFKTTEKAVA